jgi:hypothetical protein
MYLLSLFWWIILFLLLVIVGVVGIIKFFVRGAKKGVNKYKDYRNNR